MSRKRAWLARLKGLRQFGCKKLSKNFLRSDFEMYFEMLQNRIKWNFEMGNFRLSKAIGPLGNRPPSVRINQTTDSLGGIIYESVVYRHLLHFLWC